MKSSYLITFFFVFFNLFTAYSQTIINKEILCPKKLSEISNNGIPGFYYDEGYVNKIKYKEDYSFYLMIKIPSNEIESRAIPFINRIKAPKSAKLIKAKLVSISNSPSNLKITFKNREYKPLEIICIKLEGKSNEKKKWNPQFNIKATGSILGIVLSTELTYYGITIDTL